MLELALAAIQYATEGAAPDEALRLADDLLFGERGAPPPRSAVAGVSAAPRDGASAPSGVAP